MGQKVFKVIDIANAALLHYINLFSESGQVWNTETLDFEDWVDGNFADYGIALSRVGSSPVFFGELPTGLNPVQLYPYIAWTQATGSSLAPVLASDTVVAVGDANDDRTYQFLLAALAGTTTLNSAANSVTFNDPSGNPLFTVTLGPQNGQRLTVAANQ